MPLIKPSLHAIQPPGSSRRRSSTVAISPAFVMSRSAFWANSGLLKSVPEHYSLAMSASSTEERNRGLLAAVSVVVSVLLLSPLVTQADDFPVSSQPMFAEPRARLVEFVSARGVDETGASVRLSIDEIAQTDDPLVAEQFLRNADRTNDLANLCAEIAQRSEPDLSAIEIILVTHDLNLGFSENSVTSLEVLERCEGS